MLTPSLSALPSGYQPCSPPEFPSFKTRNRFWSTVFKKSPKEFIQAELEAIDRAYLASYRTHAGLYQDHVPLPYNSVCVWFVSGAYKLPRLTEPDIRGYFELEPSGDLSLTKVLREWGLENCSVMYYEPDETVEEYKQRLRSEHFDPDVSDYDNVDIGLRLSDSPSEVEMAKNFPVIKGTWKELVNTRYHDFLPCQAVRSLCWYHACWRSENLHLKRRLPYLTVTRPIVIIERPVSAQTTRNRAYREAYVMFCTVFILFGQLFARISPGRTPIALLSRWYSVIPPVFAHIYQTSSRIKQSFKFKLEYIDRMSDYFSSLVAHYHDNSEWYKVRLWSICVFFFFIYMIICVAFGV